MITDAQLALYNELVELYDAAEARGDHMTAVAILVRAENTLPPRLLNAFNDGEGALTHSDVGEG